MIRKLPPIPTLIVALAVAAMVIASGAMADDALADAMDGLFGGQTTERRLEIMKDSRHGTYGVAALALFILLRVTALGAMAGPGGRIALSFEIAYGHAFKAAPRLPADEPTRVSLDTLRGQLPSRRDRNGPQALG